MKKTSNKFPGFQECMKMRRSKDAMVMEEGFHALLPYASVHLTELIDAFRNEKEYGLGSWLIELVGEAKSPDAFPFLVENLKHEDESVRKRAFWGMQKMDTKEARTFLWERRFDFPDETDG